MRRSAGLLATMAGAILLGVGVGSLSNPGPGGVSAAEAQGSETQTFTGIFAERVGDSLEERAGAEHLVGEHEVEHVLTDARGRTTELELDEGVAEAAGGADDLNAEPVVVEGEKTPEGEIEVEEVRENEGSGVAARSAFEAEAAVQGSKPAATVLCRFGDSTGVTPHGRAWFDTLVSGDSKPSVDHFWREVSFGNLNLSGSQAFGWYNLPKPRSEYFDTAGRAKLQLLAEDCTAQADADAHFPGYPTINMMFNQDLDGYAWGGGVTLTRDGQTKTYGTTWMPPWGYENVGILGHEMGHSYGLPHSSGPYGKVYDSWWDVMSSAGLGSGCVRDATYGCMAMHTIAAHKDRLGWIPSSQRYTATSAPNQTVTVERLSTGAGGNYQLVKIPINGSSNVFYTLEARRFDGYDRHIRGEGIVAHKVDTTKATGLRTIAYVVDADNNGNPNDAGAVWTAGETFTDAANGISFRVDSETASGYQVTINPDGNADPPVVVGSTPTPDRAGVSRAANVRATFSEPMDRSTLTGHNVALYRKGADSALPAKVTSSVDGLAATLNPYGGTSRLLARNTWYLAVLWRDSDGIKDAAGHPLDHGPNYRQSSNGEYVYWWFRTKS